MKGQRAINLSLFVMIILMVIGFTWAVWYNAKGDSSNEVAPTSIAAPTPKPPREIASASIDESGNLVLLYSDNTTQLVGKVKGDKGQSLYPTDEQVSVAVVEYCSSGKCDGKTPSQSQVLEAVMSYCANGQCKGANGKDAVVTTEQLLSAVSLYCSGDRCRGQVGATGATGENGQSSQMACVIRKVNNLDTRYVAWKYQQEPNTAYRDLYKLPTWTECMAPVDLRG